MRLTGEGSVSPASAAIVVAASQASFREPNSSRKAPIRGRLPTRSDDLHDDPEDALAAGQVGEAEGRQPLGREPGLGLVGSDGAVAARAAFAGHVETTVGVQAQHLPLGQDDVGGAHEVERPPRSEGVEPHSPADQPAGEGAAQVGRVGGQGPAAGGEQRVDLAHARPGADHADLAAVVDVDVVEARQVEREPAVVRHGAAERRRGGAADRDRHRVLVAPTAGRPRPRRRGRQEDEVGNGVREPTREQLAEVDVLVAVGLVAQELVGDDALVDGGRQPRRHARGRGGAVAQRDGQLERARRRLALVQRPAVVQEGVQVGMGALGRRAARWAPGRPTWGKRGVPR